MSLIQQALEKTKRTQKTEMRERPVSPKPYELDPMGVALERELIEIQRKYAERSRRFWKVTVAFFLFFVVAVSFSLGALRLPAFSKPLPEREFLPVVTVSTPVLAPAVRDLQKHQKHYHLTGIIDPNGSAIAVINGRLFAVGDFVDAHAFVKAIGPRGVVLDTQGTDMRVDL